MVLLDTNAYSAMLRGAADVCARVRAARAIVFSTVVMGELEYGFRYGGQ